MYDDERYLDDLEFYEARYGLSALPGKSSTRKASARAARATDVATLAEASETTPQFAMTYVPARFEAEWLRASLTSFFQEEWIDDVLAIVKGGKEANVYRCLAQLHTGAELLAAKVYRPRQLRNLGNNKLYREGRTILTPEGRPVNRTDHRLLRAIGKKTTFGKQVANTSWLMHEYTTLERLHKLGAAVPRPYAANDNALLMSYYGDRSGAAPTLSGVRLERAEAQRLFEDVLRTVELMLAEGFVHGDLSAYNILYWEGRITLIDFPQITHVATNRHGRMIFRRDLQRVCDYFAAQGVVADAETLAADLWRRYVTAVPGLEPDAEPDIEP